MRLAASSSPDGARAARVEVASDSAEGAAAWPRRSSSPQGAEEILGRGRARRDATLGMKPLAGRIVLVTRPADQSGDVGPALDRRGARAIVAPGDRGGPVRSAALTPRCASSRRRVRVDHADQPGNGGDARDAAGLPRGGSRERRGDRRRDRARRSDAGPAVAGPACRRRSPPPRSRGRSRGARVACCVRAPTSRRDGLEDALAAKGWIARRAWMPTARGCRVRCPPRLARRCGTGAVDAITFTSASTVRGFVGAMGVVRGNPKVVVHRSGHGGGGPRPRADRVRRWREPHTIDGLVAALERCPRHRRR